jgi:hypothetical protein
MMELPKYFYFRLHPVKKGAAVEIEDASDVDVVEVVRCKDCENWDTTWQNDDWGKNYHYCPIIDGTRNGDWYCADAERRSDEKKNV